MCCVSISQGTPPRPRSEAAVALLGDSLLVYGGKDTSVTPNKLLGDVHCLHLHTKTWEEIHPQLAQLNPTLHGSANQQQGVTSLQQADQCQGKSDSSTSGAAAKATEGKGGTGGQGSGGAGAAAGGAGGACGQTGSRAVAMSGGSVGIGSTGSGMLLLAGHGGTAFGGSAVFCGGYQELAAPKPQPYLQVRMQWSVR